MWILLAIAFVVGWLLLKLAWGAASLLVHALLVAAVVAVVVHFMRGRAGRSAPAAHAP